MEAKKARVLTEKNFIALDKVIEGIKNQCDNGMSSFCVWNLGHDVMTELIGLGYKVSAFNDPMNGDKIHKIEW